MLLCFKETYPTTRVVIECTEFFIEISCSIRSQSVTCSNYRHHSPAKALTGMTPAGAVSFASDLYTGRTSDKQATRDCGIINLLEEDTIMADKGILNQRQSQYSTISERQGFPRTLKKTRKLEK